MALELFDAAWIFHDPRSSDLHPKMYVVESEAAATMVVGSGNLTKGGLFTNYEVALEVTLDLAIEEDASLRAEGRGYFDRLSGSSAAKPLTATLIEELMDDPTVLLGSERQANRARSGSAGAAVGSPVFGSQALSGLLVLPHPLRRHPGTTARTTTTWSSSRWRRKPKVSWGGGLFQGAVEKRRQPQGLARPNHRPDRVSALLR